MPDHRHIVVPAPDDDTAANVTRVFFMGLENHANSNQEHPKEPLSVIASDDADDLWDNMPV